jgi:antirestriction protein ArdC
VDPLSESGERLEAAREREAAERIASYGDDVIFEVIDQDNDYSPMGLTAKYFVQRVQETTDADNISANEFWDILRSDNWAQMKFISKAPLDEILAGINAELAIAPEVKQRHEMALPTATRQKSSAKSTSKATVKDIVTEAIFEQLEKGVVPWHQPWQSTGGRLPISMSTGRTYTGSNVFLLGVAGMQNGWSSPWFGTWDQIKKLGGEVKEEERKRSIPIVWYKNNDKEKDDGTMERRPPTLRYFRVYNAEQTRGLPEKYTAIELDLRTEPERIAEAEEVIDRYLEKSHLPATFVGNKAAYSPTLNEIYLPVRHGFDTSEGMYSTIFHELTHSTGHKTRLDRPGIVENHSFGDEMYSKEELVAEMGAAMSCAALDLDQSVTLPNSAAYIQSWLSALRNDKNLILQAAADAQKAVALIGVPGMEKRVEKALTEEEEITQPEPEREVEKEALRAVDFDAEKHVGEPTIQNEPVVDATVMLRPPTEVPEIVRIEHGTSIDSLREDVEVKREKVKELQALSEITAQPMYWEVHGQIAQGINELAVMEAMTEFSYAEDDLLRAEKMRSGPSPIVLVGEALANNIVSTKEAVEVAATKVREKAAFDPTDPEKAEKFASQFLDRELSDVRAKLEVMKATRLERKITRSEDFERDEQENILAELNAAYEVVKEPGTKPKEFQDILARAVEGSKVDLVWLRMQRQAIDEHEQKEELIKAQSIADGTKYVEIQDWSNGTVRNETVYPSGLTISETKRYNEAGQLLEHTHDGPKGPLTTIYRYDEQGNEIEVITTQPEGTSVTKKIDPPAADAREPEGPTR